MREWTVDLPGIVDNNRYRVMPILLLHNRYTLFNKHPFTHNFTKVSTISSRSPSLSLFLNPLAIPSYSCPQPGYGPLAPVIAKSQENCTNKPGAAKGLAGLVPKEPALTSTYDPSGAWISTCNEPPFDALS